MTKFLLILLIPNFLVAQKQEHNFKILDSLETNSSTEIRIYRVNYFAPTQILQIYLNEDSTWSYKQGFFNTNKQIIIYEEDSISIDDDLTRKHIELIKELPDQLEIDLRYTNGQDIADSLAYRLFSTVMDGVTYTIELTEKDYKKTIMYDNPKTYLKQLDNNKISTVEHDKFIELIDYYEEKYALWDNLKRIFHNIRTEK